MTLWGRAAIGALIGAVVTLIGHPLSRPFLIGPFYESGNLLNSPRFSLPTSFPKALPDPIDDISASLWVHVGAELSRQRDKITPAQLQGLVKLARIRGSHDLQNSFWKVAEAIFLDKLNKGPEAVQAWQQAAERIRYDDYQSRYLGRLRVALAEQSADGSWQYAYCYRLRSQALATQAELYARKVVSGTGLTRPEDLKLRYDTLIIGNIFRDGSRNLAAMTHATQIVELSSHPREMHNERSVKRLLMAHLDFKEKLRSAGFEGRARRVEEVYNENDAWVAMTARENASENMQNLTQLAAVLPNLPGVLLQCSLLCLALWLTGFGLNHLTEFNLRWAAIAVAIAAVALPIVVYLLTHSGLAFLATALCGAFLLISTRTPRAVPPRDLGPLFAFMNFVVAIALIAAISLVFLFRTLPVQASKAAFSEPVAMLVDPPSFAGLALIVLACLFLFSPLWALAQHLRTLTVLSKAVMGTAAIASVTSLVLAIAATPICVRMESENQETLRKIMENEPVYYLR